MYRSTQSKRQQNRRYKISKRTIKDDFIDKQIWVLHQAMVEKLIAQPALLTKVKQVLEERFEQGKIGHGAYITWLSFLEVYDDKQAFRDGILEQSKKMARLRRQTPLVGILSEEEREQALMANAIGKASISIILD